MGEDPWIYQQRHPGHTEQCSSIIGSSGILEETHGKQVTFWSNAVQNTGVSEFNKDKSDLFVE